ncbi:MAG: hypothetical protein IIY78_08275 [Clostridia bacterium]|nr:hypothetical protein [Clostridia bacterium]
MKIKASWVAFAPLSVGALMLHIYYLFFIGGENITQPLYSNYFLIINKNTEPELISVFAGIFLLFALLFSLIDRKTASYCDIKATQMSGLFLILSSLMMGVNGALSIVSSLSSGNSGLLILLFNILSVITGMLLASVGMGLMIGYNIAKKMRVTMLLPTIWAAINLVMGFLSHRREAPSFALFDMFVWVTLTLFLFNSSMVLCGVEIKNPIKSSFIWGLLLVYYDMIYVISEIDASMKEFGSFQFLDLLPQLMVGSFGLYALFFLMKLSKSMITKEQEKALESSEEKSETKSGKHVKNDDKSDDEPEAAFGVGSTKYVTAEFEKIRIEKAAKKAKERTDSLPVIPSTDDFDNDDNEEEELSTLDKIDQLIQELSEE